MVDMNISSKHANYYTSAVNKVESDAKTTEKTKEADDKAAIYEKSDSVKSATYNVNKMSPEDRASLVAQIKAEQENRMAQLTNLVREMMTGQAGSYAKTNDSMWRLLADGDFTVDPATKAQAQADIAEDGYWGVKQTSQRLFDFAAAIAGDDVDKMKEMQLAMQKGFDQATKAWGRELPDISQDTMKASNQLFEDYYTSKQVNN